MAAGVKVRVIVQVPLAAIAEVAQLLVCEKSARVGSTDADACDRKR